MFTKNNPFSIIYGYVAMFTMAEKVKPAFVDNPLIEQLPRVIQQRSSETVTIHITEYFGMFEDIQVRFYNLLSIEQKHHGLDALLPSECGLPRIWDRQWQECEYNGWESKGLTAEQYLALHKSPILCRTDRTLKDTSSLARHPVKGKYFPWDKGPLHIPQCPGIKGKYGLVFEIGPRIREYDSDYSMFISSMEHKRNPMDIHPEEINFLAHVTSGVRVSFVNPNRKDNQTAWPSLVGLDAKWDQHFRQRSNNHIGAYGLRPKLFQEMLAEIFARPLYYTLPKNGLLRHLPDLDIEEKEDNN